MDALVSNMKDRLQQDVAELSLRRLNFGIVIAAVIVVFLFAFAISGASNLSLMVWCLSISVIVGVRGFATHNLNQERAGDNGLINYSLCRKIDRLALFSGISDGIIWSSANWVIFHNSLANHYLLISLTIGAASTYGLIYLFQPAVAVIAAGLAILPLLVFSYLNFGAEAYQLVVFVAVFCFAISFGINELKKLILNFHMESFEHEMTSRKEREANFIFNQHWSNTPLAAVEWDRKFRICRWNPSAEAIFGYRADEAIGQSLDLIFSIAEASKMKTKWRKLWRSQSGERSVKQCKNKDGDLVHCEWHDSPLSRNGIAIGITSFVEDISSQVTSEEIIKTQANFDNLTGLPNRRQMISKINETIERSKNSREFAALIFLDLDHFKDINDTKGHEVGDIVLKEFAKKLRLLIRHNDMVARFGGDEFVVLLEGLGKSYKGATESTQLVADKLLEAGANLCNIDGINYHLDASGGITLFDGSSGSASELLKTSDLAMYQVKQNGRKGICFYDESLSLEADYRVEVLRSLRTSLENDEFELYCQPIVDTDGNICYYENLLRWRRGNNQIASACDFIDIASNSPMMIELGYWIFDNACQNINRLRDQNLWKEDEAFFINVSPRQLVDDMFASRVMDILREHNIAPSWVTIEITEECLIRSYDVVIKQLNQLVSYGIRIALDDFGTGYSSLALLKDLPTHYLKLDKEFIRSLKGKRNRSKNKNNLIVQAIIKLCDVMSLKVIAEGVETEDQFETLKAMGCDYIQGYYFHKPMSLENLVDMLGQEQKPEGSNIYKFKKLSAISE